MLATRAFHLTGDRTSYFHALAREPYAHDFFHALRQIECLYADKPRLGTALRPADEPIRLAQQPSMNFAPATLAAFDLPTSYRPARMQVHFFGLLGANGPLPLHLTEYTYQRKLHAGDETFARWLDVFHHRFLQMFYRAWAQAQPTVNLDRPRDDRFSVYVGALLGLGSTALRQRDEVADAAKKFFAGRLAAAARNPEGLAAMLTDYFHIPVRVESFVGQWLKIPPRDRSYLGSGRGNDGTQLGVDTNLGAKVWSRQSKFRLWLGPLSLEQYESFLPGGAALDRLIAWVRQYLCFEFDWDIRLVLAAGLVPKTTLGGYGQLGWTNWLGIRNKAAGATDLILNPERIARVTASRKRAAPSQQSSNLRRAGRIDQPMARAS
ncbi:MAG: type VI secretion system baseplate subunit TssG [Gammaproteobacteria bacterium]|nr:type VI secretion system baseplate subunit TssG [Gammaproteobacteria bacterium]